MCCKMKWHESSSYEPETPVFTSQIGNTFILLLFCFSVCFCLQNKASQTKGAHPFDMSVFLKQRLLSSLLTHKSTLHSH